MKSSPRLTKTAFIFYNPYRNEDICCVGELEKKLGGEWKLYRQDISRQDLLYRELQVKATVSVAFYQDGKLLEVKGAEQC